MTIVHDASPDVRQTAELEPGVILVNSLGNLRVLRSRARDGVSWNCADGAAIADVDATNTDKWKIYRPEQLAADLALAAELRAIAGERELSGGLATWDACSGRPCALPRVAKIVR